MNNSKKVSSFFITVLMIFIITLIIFPFIEFDKSNEVQKAGNIITAGYELQDDSQSNNHEDIKIPFMGDTLVVSKWYDVGTFSLVLVLIEQSDDPLSTLELIQRYERLEVEPDVRKKILEIIN